MPGDVNINLFQGIGGSLEKATEVFVVSTSSSIIATITPWAIAGMGLWICMYGYMVIGGKIQDPLMDFLFKTLKMMSIAYVALHADVYLEWVVGFIRGLESSLTAAITQSGATTLYESLDHTLEKGMKLIKESFEKLEGVSWYEFGKLFKWLVVSLTHSVTFSLVTLVGGVVIITATVMLKIMFAIGPVFIMCLMWPFTARFFDSWLSQALTYVLRILLAGAALTLCLKVFEYFAQKIDASGSTAQNVVLVALECVMAGFILNNVVKEAIGIAGQLSGGISAAAMGAGQLAAGAKAPLAAAKNLINPKRTRRDLKTGIVTTSSRFGHMIAGNTLLNPAYIQAGWQNMRSRWGHMKGGSAKESK